MATISASPRVAPLRWSSVAGIEPSVDDRQAFPEVSAEATAKGVVDAVQWRIVGWIAAVFLGTLVLSGLLNPAMSASNVSSPAVAVAGPAETVAHPAYTVEAGDTLWDIATATAPTSDPRTVVGEIRELNGLSTGHVLQAGEVLMLPTADPR